MIDYVFFDKTTNYVNVRTDAVDINTNTFTILEVAHAAGGYTSLSNAIQTSLGLNLNVGPTTKQALIALATTLAWGLGAFPVGAAVTTPVSLATTALAAPTSLVGATGAGAAGTLTLTITGSTNGTNYVIDQATNVGFTTGVVLGIYSGNQTGVALVVSGLTPATAYFFRVRAQSNYLADSATTASGSVTSHA